MNSRPLARTASPATALLLAAILTACQPQDPALTLDQAFASLDVDAFLEHMNTLSSDAMAGRRPGTAGYDAAAAYVAREAQAAGLEPGGANGTYLQPIRFRRAGLGSQGATLTVGSQVLAHGTDFSVSPRVTEARTQLRAPLVFLGYGISAADLGYDDYDGVEVAGKLAVVLSGAPDGFGSLERTVLSHGKTVEAELIARGAAGIIRVQPDGARLVSGGRTGYLVPGEPVADVFSSEELSGSVTVPERIAAAWVATAGHDLNELRARIASGRPSSFDLDVEGRFEAWYDHEEFESANVAARLPGSDRELRDEHLVVTAHLDHLGTGAPLNGDSIFNGTLDNASGSAAILTLAATLARMERPRRSILFLWVTAEESGMLGSEYFARFPTLESGRIVANQNMDGVMGMIAAATDVLAFGYEHSNLSEAVDFAVARTGNPVSPDPTPEENLFVRSDQYAFVRQGIPAIWVQAGRTSVDPAIDAQGELDRWIVERYHKPTDDTAQPVDLRGVRSELENNLLVTVHIANEMGDVQWDPGSFLGRRWGGG